MKYYDITYLDGSNGFIGISDRGFSVAPMQLFVLDNPVIRINYGTSTAESVTIDVQQGGNSVAYWTLDNTLTVAYVEMGDVLRYVVQPVTPVANQIVAASTALSIIITAYDGGGNSLNSYTMNVLAFRSSKYTSSYGKSLIYSSLPSKFRMLFAGSFYDYAKYNIVAVYPRSFNGIWILNGNTVKYSAGATPHAAWNWLAASRITNVRLQESSTVIENAVVETPACPESIIALKWWSRIGGCWKSVVLDVVGGGYTSDNTIDYWTDLEQDQLKSGTTYITARFPNATYKDYLYYSDIIMGEHLTASVRASNYGGGYEDAPVKVSGNWSYKQNDIKDMDFTITIKTYDLDD